MKFTRLQLADIEKALDSMAMELIENGLMKHPIQGFYENACRHVREVPPGHRKLRSDFNRAWSPAAKKRIEIE